MRAQCCYNKASLYSSPKMSILSILYTSNFTSDAMEFFYFILVNINLSSMLFVELHYYRCLHPSYTFWQITIYEKNQYFLLTIFSSVPTRKSWQFCCLIIHLYMVALKFYVLNLKIVLLASYKCAFYEQKYSCFYGNIITNII